MDTQDPPPPSEDTNGAPPKPENGEVEEPKSAEAPPAATATEAENPPEPAQTSPDENGVGGPTSSPPPPPPPEAVMNGGVEDSTSDPAVQPPEAPPAVASDQNGEAAAPADGNAVNPEGQPADTSQEEESKVPAVPEEPSPAPPVREEKSGSPPASAAATDVPSLDATSAETNPVPEAAAPSDTPAAEPQEDSGDAKPMDIDSPTAPPSSATEETAQPNEPAPPVSSESVVSQQPPESASEMSSTQPEAIPAAAAGSPEASSAAAEAPQSSPMAVDSPEKDGPSPAPQSATPPPGPPQPHDPPPLPQHPAAAPPQQPPAAPVDRGMRELRVEDALLYLDHVKMEFKDRPQIYNQFLAIMKNFKSQEVDTPGVIKRVSKLFRGYNNLILGFNTFLPDGFKISLADLQREEREEIAREEAAEEAARDWQHLQVAPAQANQQPSPAANWQKMPYAEGPGGVAPRHSPQQEAAAAARQQQHVSPAAKVPTPPQQAQKPTPQSGQRKGAQQSAGKQIPTVEFDHAISYVTTIKRRFANDPSTYHQFLEILHTYQKEQRGIKEVLEQVAHLFQDHPDLLKEFTFFLPDAVQEQAKERLHRAAAESESRQALQRQQQMEQYQNIPSRASASHQKFIDMTRSGVPIDSGVRKRPLEVAPGSAQHVEANVYNSAVERQFFDAAREALTSYSRDGGQAWAEFLKCLDMYAQDILSRTEMLNFVEPLLGKRNTKLFEEFKRILSAAGSPAHPLPLMEDSWHSVPLSEIDFSRCRRCSPSYRALPRDYPAPPCSDRSEMEAKILNDIWVSLPVGSEESYTFRHMRRNTYEETLFRVEDERFEIDMVIDSNASTLRRLEPIAEEIAQLSQEELGMPDLGTKPSVEGAGLGGRRFQYTFDKTILGVIHRNTIARIYGDAGQEMLDLMVKNPTVSIPVVVERLKQKDREWRIVRERLNRNWMELAQHNYYRSLDHRGLTWRTIDKRGTSSRTLISEIKDRAANGGKEGREALKQKLDKAKEEHGTFYEVTMGNRLSQNLDLTFLPKPDRRLFTPHLSLMYENNSWAQRDAYRILAFALERGHISPADKERCHRLWTDFLGPYFGLSLGWMQHPAVAYQESTAAGPAARAAAAKPTLVSEDDDSLDEETEMGSNVVTEELNQNGEADLANDKDGLTDHHPLPSGAHVSTLYGEGKVIEFRRSDHIYVVQLSFGAKGYLRPATVLCSVLPVEKSPYTKKLRSNDLSRMARQTDQLVIGNQNLYVFFRLHQILVRRLNIAKHLAYSVCDDRSMKTLVEQMPQEMSSNPKAAGRRRYEAYLSLVYALLDGGVSGASEGGKYEDRLRSLLGHGAYELATMDKLISHLWKNLQSLAGDEAMWNLVQLYRRHLAEGSFQPESFRQEAAYHSEGEQMYAFQYCPLQGDDKAVLHFEYLGVMEDPEGVNDDEDEDMEDADPIEDEDVGLRAAMSAPVQEVAEPVSKRARR